MPICGNVAWRWASICPGSGPAEAVRRIRTAGVLQMKDKAAGFLLAVAVEAVHFIVLTGILCGVGFFTRDNGETAVTFRQLLWEGGVSFWFDGYGAILLLGLVIVIGWILLDFFC